MIVENLISEASVSKTREGWAATYAYLVQFDEPPQTTAAFINASGVPTIGNACADYNAIVCTGKTLEMIDPCTAKVTVNFSPKTVEDSGFLISISASLTTQMTNMDRDGDTLPTLSSKDKPTIPKTIPMVPKMVPSISISARKLFALSPQAMSDYIKDMGGKKNAQYIFGISGNEDKFLCTRITADQLADELYDVVTEWQYDEKKWRSTAVLTDPGTNAPLATASTADKSMADLDPYDHRQPPSYE